MSQFRLRVGIAGLGSASSKVLPWLCAPNCLELNGLVLAAAADCRLAARQAFEATYHCPAYATVSELCDCPHVDVVYVATPSSLHCEHTLAAVAAGKHVLCEKPLAIQLEDCDRMIEAARRAGVLLVQGHSKVFDAPVLAMREVIESGELGAVFHVDIWNFNDWMRRPRLAAELDTGIGGGVVLRQGPQLVDLARILIGTAPRAVRAVTGRHAAGLDTEGNFSALVEFDGGATATLSFNGYGHLGLGALFAPRLLPDKARSQRLGPVSASEKYRGPDAATVPPSNVLGPSPTGELAVVSCERGVIVQSPYGLHLHRDGRCDELPIHDTAGRAGGLVELRNALRDGRPGFPDGPWARTTLEVCLAILQSSHQGNPVPILGHPAATTTEVGL